MNDAGQEDQMYKQRTMVRRPFRFGSPLRQFPYVMLLAVLLGLLVSRVGWAQDASRASDVWDGSPPDPRANPLGQGDTKHVVAGTASAREDLRRLEALLQVYRAHERSRRLWVGVSAMAAGAVTIPVSRIIERRTGEDSIVGSLLLGLGIGQFGGGLVTLVMPESGFSRLASMLEEQRASGRTAAEILVAMESEWERLANEARSVRHVIGIVGLSLTAVSLGGATYLALSDTSGLSNEARYNSSAALLGLGAFTLFLGGSSLFAETNIETGWHTYRITGRPRSPQVGFGLAPAPGGGIMQITGSF